MFLSGAEYTLWTLKAKVAILFSQFCCFKAKNKRTKETRNDRMVKFAYYELIKGKLDDHEKYLSHNFSPQQKDSLWSNVES